MILAVASPANNEPLSETMLGLGRHTALIGPQKINICHMNFYTNIAHGGEIWTREWFVLTCNVIKYLVSDDFGRKYNNYIYERYLMYNRERG